MRSSRGNPPLVWRFHVTFWARFYSSQGSCGSVLPQRASIIWLSLFHRVHLAIPPHTMPAVYPKATRKYVSLCLKKAQKSLAKGNFTLCFLPPLSKVCCVCLSQCVCLQKQCTTELQPEKYQYLLHTIRKKESSLNRYMGFLNWFSQHVSIPRWLSFYSPPVTTDILFSVNLQCLHFISCSTVLLRLCCKQKSWHGTSDHKKMVSVCLAKIFSTCHSNTFSICAGSNELMSLSEFKE